MNLSTIDLNLLVYLDVLLREKNVTRAAHHLGITQPAMSNGLRRLRNLFDDPLLIRTSGGMTATEYALHLQPLIRDILAGVEVAVQPQKAFDPSNSKRVFRIMASDYGESTLLPSILSCLHEVAPHVTLDILTPSDVGFPDLEQGKVDMAINRFDELPMSFHKITLWQDQFVCLMSKDNPCADNFTLKNYLKAQHIWVNKTGMGVGVGMNPNDKLRLGRVDEALDVLGEKRDIRLFTRHYQVARQLARQKHLIATLPEKAAFIDAGNDQLVALKPPFEIEPVVLDMAWSPLLQHNSGHQWMRRLIASKAKEIDEGSA
jgi:DNA-binding transcriptional LysR family regulator